MDDYVETASDLHVKHEGTYIGHLSDRETIRISTFVEKSFEDSDLTKILCNYTKILDKDPIMISTLWEDLKPELILEYPNMGAINYKNSVVCVSRKLKQESPSKYRKTLRAGSFLTFDPNIRERQILDLDILPIGFTTTLTNTIINSIIFNSYPAHDEALDKILSFTNIGSAFSSLYYYTLDFNGDKIPLWRDNNIIGKYNPKSKLTDLNNNYFTNELEDLGLKIGYTYEN